MKATVDTKATSALELMSVQSSLTSLAQNISKENLAFLAELSKRNGINSKIEKNKNMIKNFL